MARIETKKLISYIENNINEFNEARLNKIGELNLNDILLRKNPYLFKAKNILTSQDLIQNLVDAYLSSQEETMFGTFLEGLAIYVCQIVHNGKKSAAEGIDLEFEKDSIKYIVTVKSGPNWGNSSQIVRMRDNFRKAKRILGTNAKKINVVAVNGCCYGRVNKIDKGEYLKLAGQQFWELISNEKEMYLRFIEPLDYIAKERNDLYIQKYSALLNKFTQQFSNEFCVNGIIDWKKLVKFNSGKEKI
ncbi:MAG: PmeII family type II restriction endonuclease [Ignavibacteriaceae bacterium]|jgi:hypothetical protein|nr:PmeII family type II restriction endonuclease [Ignavibacteriaceae bacterium]